MAISVVQTIAAAQQVTATPTVTVPSAAAGNTLVVFVGRRGGTAAPTGISDSVNGAWTIDATRGLWNGPVGVGVGAGIYFFPNTAAGSPLITVTFASSDTMLIQAEELTSTDDLEREDSATGDTVAGTSHPLDTTIDIATAGIAYGNSTATSTLTETPATGFTALGDGGFRMYAQRQIVASGGLSDTISWTSGSGSTALVGLALREAAAGDPAPSIIDVDEDNTITLEQANVEIDGTDFDTATVELRQGGFVYEPSIDSQSGTAIQFDMAAVGTTGPVSAPHPGAATLAVVNGDAQEDTQAITISDRADSDSVLVGTPNADPDLRLDGTADVEAGDYVMWFNVQGGAVGDVTVNDDLTFDVEASVTAFDFQIWDADDGTWGDAATQDIVVADEVPDAFDFDDLSSQPLSTVITSDSETPTGYDSAAISVTGGEYSINGGAFTSVSGTITSGDSVRARGTSSASNSTAVNVDVTIGGVTGRFTITTLAAASGVSKFRMLMGVG